MATTPTIHIVGPGAIGSFLAFHLRNTTPNPIRLHRRRRDSRIQPAFPLNPPIGFIQPPISISLYNDDNESSQPLTTSGFEMEFSEDEKLNVQRRHSELISCLFCCTKAHQAEISLRRFIPRLKGKGQSTICLVGNGVLSSFPKIASMWNDPMERPSFILASTSHGVHAFRNQQISSTKTIEHISHGSFVHAGRGEIHLGIVPSLSIQSELQKVKNQDWTFSGVSSSPDVPAVEALLDEHDTFDLSETSNPLLCLSTDLLEKSIKPNLKHHLPHTSVTDSLHTMLSLLLHCKPLDAKWLTLSDWYTQAQAKVAVNCAANAVASLLRCRNGYMLADPNSREVMRSILEECAQVYAAIAQRGQGENSIWPTGVRPGLTLGDLERRTATVLRATSTNVSSTLASMPDTGELDHLNGWIVKMGQLHGVPVVANATVLRLAQALTGIWGTADEVNTTRKDRGLRRSSKL